MFYLEKNIRLENIMKGLLYKNLEIVKDLLENPKIDYHIIYKFREKMDLIINVKHLKSILCI